MKFLSASVAAFAALNTAQAYVVDENGGVITRVVEDEKPATASTIKADSKSQSPSSSSSSSSNTGDSSSKAKSKPAKKTKFDDKLMIPPVPSATKIDTHSVPTATNPSPALNQPQDVNFVKKPKFDFPFRAFIEMRTRPSQIADDIPPLHMTFELYFHSNKLWRISYYNYVQVDYHVGTQQKDYKYVYKNGERICLQKQHDEYDASWAGFQALPDLANYTYTGDKVVRNLLCHEFTGGVPENEINTDKGGYYKFYVDVVTGYPVQWTIHRARNPVFNAHTDIWEFQYQLFQPIVTSTPADIEEILEIFEVPLECQVKPIVFPSLSLGFAERVQQNQKTNKLIDVDESATAHENVASNNGEIKSEKHVMQQFRRNYGRKFDTRKGIYRIIAQIVHDNDFKSDYGLFGLNLVNLVDKHKDYIHRDFLTILDGAAGSELLNAKNDDFHDLVDLQAFRKFIDYSTSSENDERETETEREHKLRQHFFAALRQDHNTVVDIGSIQQLFNQHVSKRRLGFFDPVKSILAEQDTQQLQSQHKLIAELSKLLEEEKQIQIDIEKDAKKRQQDEKEEKHDMYSDSKSKNSNDKDKQQHADDVSEKHDETKALTKLENVEKKIQDVERKLLPEFYDVRHLLKAVRDQGICGSCWSFAFIAAVEGALAKNGVQYEPLSEQFILDCAWGQGSHACDGGDAGANEMLGIGIPETSKYGGYLSASGRCHYGMDARTAVSKWMLVRNNDLDVKQALFLQGVLSVSFLVTDKLLYYGGGVVDDPKCEGVKIWDTDHAVAMVGYDDKYKKPYWVIRNSWSTAWGEQGYFRIVQGKRDCGMTLDVGYPEVTDANGNGFSIKQGKGQAQGQGQITSVSSSSQSQSQQSYQNQLRVTMPNVDDNASYDAAVSKDALKAKLGLPTEADQPQTTDQAASSGPSASGSGPTKIYTHYVAGSGGEVDLDVNAAIQDRRLATMPNTYTDSVDSETPLIIS